MPDRMPADARIAGLVNNAGIAGPGPVECVPSGKLRHLFDVVIVESGAVPAHTWDKAASTLGRAAGATGRYQTLITGVQHRIIERGARHGVPAQTVARVIARALTARRQGPGCASPGCFPTTPPAPSCSG